VLLRYCCDCSFVEKEPTEEPCPCGEGRGEEGPLCVNQFTNENMNIQNRIPSKD
jgi:hypothetical protein